MIRVHLTAGQTSFFGKLALGVALAFAAGNILASAAEPTQRTESFEHLLNSNSSGQFDHWRSNTPGSYEARQIIGDVELAQQLNDSSKPADELDTAASVLGKKHHLHPVAIALLVAGGILVLSAAVLLIWSRIVQYREMHDAPSPMAFDYPRI